MRNQNVEDLRFRCTACGTEHPVAARAWRCSECEGPLVLVGMPSFDKAKIDERLFTLWRYYPFVPSEARVTIGEGCTPLIEARDLGAATLYKLEYVSPTGSFKDRGMSFLTTFLRMMGVTEVIEDSSGNAGASLSAYAARAGIAAQIFVPNYTSETKLRQILVHGAALVRVPGTRDDTTRAAEAAARSGRTYASHYWSPFALEGLKTFAFEVAEQLGWRCPDNVVFPCGHGTLLLGAYYGFQALRTAGVVTRLPRLFCVQAAACAPIANAFASGAESVAGTEPTATVAEGIRIGQPARGRDILAALRTTQGAAVSVLDEDILEACDALARVGLSVEITSATSVAGLKHLRSDGTIGAGELTVLALTGSGLKNP